MYLHLYTIVQRFAKIEVVVCNQENVCNQLLISHCNIKQNVSPKNKYVVPSRYVHTMCIDFSTYSNYFFKQ